MNKRQAKRIALGFLASIAIQDDTLSGRFEGDGCSESDSLRIEEAMRELAQEFTRRAGIDTEFVVVPDMIRAVLGTEEDYASGFDF